MIAAIITLATTLLSAGVQVWQGSKLNKEARLQAEMLQKAEQTALIEQAQAIIDEIDKRKKLAAEAKAKAAQAQQTLYVILSVGIMAAGVLFVVAAYQKRKLQVPQ